MFEIWSHRSSVKAFVPSSSPGLLRQVTAAPPAPRGIRQRPFFLLTRVALWHFSPLQIFVPLICHSWHVCHLGLCLHLWRTALNANGVCLSRCTKCESQVSSFIFNLGKHPDDSLLLLHIFIKCFAIWAHKNQFSNAISHFKCLPITMENLSGW